MSDEATKDGPAATPGPPAGARCLSANELAALSSPGPEPLPVEVAAHLASCERCQRLALFGERQARRVKQAPSLRDAFVRVGLVLAAVAMVLASFYILLR